MFTFTQFVSLPDENLTPIKGQGDIKMFSVLFFSNALYATCFSKDLLCVN